MKSIKDFVLFVTLLTPCMPKLALGKEIFIYPIEIILILTFPLFIRKRFFLKKTLLSFWGCISISTLLSFIYGPIEIGGAMRCIKGIIYIPLIYIAYTSKRYSYNNMAFILIIAAIINIAFHYSQGFSIINVNIWDSEALMSGLSRWSYNIFTNRFNAQEGSGTHNIWGDYCVLAMCASWLSYNSKKINKVIFICTIIAAITSLSLAVSREAFVVLISVFAGYFLANSIKNGKLHINGKAYLFLFLIIIAISYAIVKYGDNIALFKKMVYTIDSFESSGKEQNLNLRIGAWSIFGLSLIENPWAFFLGYGFNRENYTNCIDNITNKMQNDFVTLPESFFVQALSFGGIICLIYGIKYWKHMYSLFKSYPNKMSRYILIGLYCGLLFGSIFSGSAITSDLLYGQFLILIGFLKKEIKIYQSHK